MRLNRSFRNYLTSLVVAAATMTAALVTTPYLTRRLGDARLGAFRTAYDWVQQLQLLELGLGGAMFPLFARALGRGDEDDVRAAFDAGFQAYLGVTLLMLAGGLTLAAAIPHLIPGLDPSLRPDLRLGVLVGLLTLLFVPLSAFRFLLDASQRGYVTNLGLAGQALAIMALSLVFARAGLGIAGQFLAVVGGLALSAAVLARAATRLRPGLVRPRALVAPAWRRDPALWRTLWSFSLPALLLAICGRLSLTCDNIIIGFCLGPVLVLPFAFSQRLALTAQLQLQGIGSATVAALAELHVTGQDRLFEDRLIELTKLVCVLSLAAMVPIAAYNERFVTLWVGPRYHAGWPVDALAAINALTLALLTLWGFVFQATGRLRRTVPIGVASAVVNVGASLAGTYFLGLPGPLLGTFLSRLVGLPWMPRLLRRDFGLSLRRLGGAVGRPLALGLPYAGLLWAAARVGPARGRSAWAWADLAAEMGGAALLFLALAWALLYGPAERAVWIDRLRSLLGRPRPAAVEPGA